MRTLVGLLLALVLAVPAAAQTGRVSAGNSTTAVLGSGATFTGAWDDATQAAVVVVTIKADQASATNGVKVEFSSDCVNQDYVTTHSFTDTVNGQTFADAMAAKCVRIEFVNGASGQGSFRLQTVVRDNGYGGTSAGGGVAGSVTINDPTITTQKLAINASGQASMTCANCSGTGASAVDRATFTPGTNSIAPSGGMFDDTPPTDLTAGMAGTVRMTPKRAFHINLRNQAGTEVGTSTTPLQVTGANGTFPVTGTFFQATQPVSIAAAIDVSDRAGRLVGVVYGSQAQQLKQTATNFNLQSELAVGGALIDPRDVSDRSGRALGSIANLFVLDATLTGRLPAGASPASAETNTNTNLSRIGTYPFVFNGTTWDRWTGAVTASSWPLPTGAATETTLGTRLADATYTGRTPAGASPADAESNTSTSLSRIGDYVFVFNGTTWDRLRGDATNGAFVNVKTSVLPTGAATETTLGTRLADATFTGRMPAGASPANGETNTSTSLSRVGAYPFIFNGTTWDRWTGAVSISGSLPAGAALLGEVAFVTTATTTDALSTCYLTSAATTNATNCKASAGNVYAIHVTNTTTTNYFLRLYNLATAPTCSSATGFVETVVALGAAANGGINGRVTPPQGYSTGIGFCLTGGGASTDNTNAATGVYITIEYKLED